MERGELVLWLQPPCSPHGVPLAYYMRQKLRGGACMRKGSASGSCQDRLQHVDWLLRLPCAQVALISGLDEASVKGVLKSKHHDGTHLNNALKVVTIRKEKGKERQGISLPGGSVIPEIDGAGDLSK